MKLKTERFEMRLDQETQKNVDAWRAEQPDLPSRAEAMRRLVNLGLSTTSKKEIVFSGGEKLSLMMLCEMITHLKIKSDLDVDLIKNILLGGHYWALDFEFPGLFHGYIDDREIVDEVSNVLNMWMLLEEGYGGLDKKGKATVEKQAKSFSAVVFRGFSGNEESEYMGIARFLIEDLDRFSIFKGRDLNSHFPMIDAYRRMLKVFEPMRSELIGKSLNASQIVEILNEQVHPDNRGST